MTPVAPNPKSAAVLSANSAPARPTTSPGRVQILLYERDHLLDGVGRGLGRLGAERRGDKQCGKARALQPRFGKLVFGHASPPLSRV